AAAGPQPDDTAAMSEFLLRGYRAYLESFPFARGEMTMTRGETKTVEDALAGRWLTEHEPFTISVFWAFDGEWRRYDKTYDAALVERLQRHEASSRQVTNRSLEIYESDNISAPLVN